MLSLPIFLLLTYCTTATPSECSNVTLMPDSGVFQSTQDCMVQGQELVAAFMQEHPGYNIRAWYCGPKKEDL